MMDVGKRTHSPNRCESNPSRRILVVEENDATRRLNTKVLLLSGDEVDTAKDGEVAREALQLNGFELFIRGKPPGKVRVASPLGGCSYSSPLQLLHSC